HYVSDSRHAGCDTVLSLERLWRHCQPAAVLRGLGVGWADLWRSDFARACRNLCAAGRYADDRPGTAAVTDIGTARLVRPGPGATDWQRAGYSGRALPDGCHRVTTFGDFAVGHAADCMAGVGHAVVWYGGCDASIHGFCG